MKTISNVLLTFIFVLFLSFPVQVEERQNLSLIMRGETEDGIYYEIYGDTFETLAQRGSVSLLVTRIVIYHGKVTPPAQISWVESIDDVIYTGTLHIRQYRYNAKNNIVSATYEGFITAQ